MAVSANVIALSDADRALVEAHLAEGNQPEDLGRWSVEDLSPREITEILTKAKANNVVQ